MSELERTLALDVPDALAVASGEPAQLGVQVTNLSDEALVVTVRAVGADTGSSQVLQLAPHGSGTVELTVVVPAGFPGQEQSAGVEAVARRAHDPYGQVLSRTLAPVLLVLDEGAELHARLQPAEVRGARRAGLSVELENRGSAPVEVRLRDDRSRRATIDFHPTTVTVPAGGRSRVPATVRRPRALVGSTRRTSFGVVVATRQRELRLPGGFTQTPVLSRGFAGLVALLAVIAVWASALTIGLQQMGSDDSRREVAEAAAASDGGSDAGDDGGTSDGGSTDGGSGTTVDPADGAGDDLADEQRVRVGGTVDAADRSGVAVTIEPVSLADAMGSGAPFAQSRPGLRMVDGPPKRFGRSVGIAAQTLSSRRATTTDVDGGWAFGGVRAPGLYLVTFAKAGYETQKFIVEAVEGEQPPDLDVKLEAGAGSITGRVVTGAGAGLGGVEIVATDGTVSLTTTTVSEGAVGSFSLEGLSTPGSWSLTTSRAGYGAETARVDLAGSGSAQGVVLTVESGVAAIGGTVISAEGPVGGLTVEVTNGELTRTATTLTEGATGSFLVPALPIPGVYTVSVHGEGWQTLTEQVDLRADAQLSLEMRRSTAQLVGTITDADTGSGIGGVGITLVSDGQTFKSSSAGAADDGGFELRGIPPGSYVVTFELYGYATEQVLVALSAGDRKPVDVAMVPVPPETLPDESTIQGQVTSTIGDAIAGALIEVELTVALVDEAGNVEVTTRTVTATTDGQGNYSVGGLPPGIHRVTASATGYAPSSRSTRVGVGAAVTIDFALVPNATVSGRVLSNFDGLPRADAVVRIRPAGATAWLHETTTTVAAPGEAPGYTFEGASSVPSGTYELQVASLDDHRPSALVTIEVAAPQDVTQDLRVDRLGHLRVRVVEPAQGQLQPLPGAALTIRDASGADVCSQIIPVDSGRTCPVTTTGDIVELAGLEPGSFLATATLADYSDGTSGAVAVRLNQTTDALVALSPRPGTVTGTVEWMRDGRRVGVPDPTVEMTFVSAYNLTTFEFYESRCTATGSATGNFAFDFTSGSLSCVAVGFPNGFPADVFDFGVPIFGTATFVARADGFETSAPTSRVLSGPVVLRLQPLDGTITGQVTLDDGPASAGSLTGITATVLSRPSEGTGVLQVVVDANGGISATEAGTPGVTPGPYEIRFTKAGYDPATVQICVGPGDTPCTTPYEQLTNDASVTLDRQGRVTVSAVSRPDPTKAANPGNNEQRALTGVTFTLTPAGGGTGRELTASATQSSVTFEGVSAGSYQITAQRTAYEAPGPLAVEVQIGTHSSNNQVVFKRFGSITGRLIGVTGQGTAPIANATVTATGPDNATTTFQAVTDAKGEFTLESSLPDARLTDGSYAVTTSDLGQRGWTDLALTGADAVQVSNADVTALGDLELEATPASISGTVLDDASGDPISGARVYLYRDTAAGRVDEELTTGATGTFSFTDLTPAIWNLEVTKAGYGLQRTQVDLVSNRVVTGFDVELALLQNTVLGNVDGRFGSTDLPLEGVDVQVVDVVTDAEVGTAVTGADGSYRVDGLLDGSYEVRFTKVGFEGTSGLVDPQGGVSRRVDATLAVKRRTVEVTVTSAVGGTAIDGASVTLTAVVDDPTATTAGPASTDANGVATIADVLPGSYTVDVEATGGHLAGSTTLTVPISDATAAVTASVTIAEAELSGIVSYDDGTTSAPVDGAVVSVYADPTDVDPVLQLTTHDGGTYQAYVEPGTYTVVVAHEGAVAQGEVTLAAGDTDGLSPTLGALGSIEVTVTDAGSAVPDATVVLELADGSERSPTSSAGGTYTFDGVPPGDHTVSVTADAGALVGSATVTLGPGGAETVPVAVAPV